MSGLPKRWANAALSEVTEVIMGQSPPSSAYNDVGLGLPFLQGKAEFGALRPIPVKWCTDAKKVAEAEDILVSVRAPVGPTNLAPTRCCIGRGLAALRPLGGLENRFLLYQIRAREHELERLGHGVTFKAIRKKELTSWPTLVAPLPEQHRIVAKIESLFARLDKGVAALKRAEATLERYRASVLKAAVEGRLTERWRRENPPTETGEELLGRILAERRKRWEVEQLAKFEAEGRKPPRGWKAKYREPVRPDASGLPGLPEGWCWATVDQVAGQMRNGRSVRTRAQGFPVLRLSAITGAVLDHRDVKEGDWGPEEAAPFRVRQDDFFVSRGNGSLDLVGRASFADDCVGEVAFPDTMIRVTFVCRQFVRARFVAAIWNSQFIRAQITDCAKTSAGIHKISQLDLRSVLLPVPPVEEQDRITASHRDFESARSHLANRITSLCQHASALRQSILRCAFDGRLVLQDPADEPATVLLERIQTEREGERTRGKRRLPKPRRQRRSRVP